MNVDRNIKLFALAVLTVMVASAFMVAPLDADDSEKCKVTLVSNITGVENEVVEITKGGFLTSSDVFNQWASAHAQEGKTFLGWQIDRDLETPYLINLHIDHDMKLYAKWMTNETQFAITLMDTSNTGYVPPGYGTHVIGTVVVNKNTKASEPSEPSRDGYKFAGWYTRTVTESGPVYEKYDWSTEVTDNVTLYATWEKTSSIPSGIIFYVALALTIVFMIAAIVTRSIRIGIVCIVFLALTVVAATGVFDQLIGSVDRFFNW